MSASAFIATPNSIIALSDGLRVDLETHEPIGTNFRKVFKVSSRTLITTGGSIIKDEAGKTLPEIACNYARKLDISDPEGVASIISKLLDKAPRHDQRFDMINYTVMGFDGSGQMRRFHFTGETGPEITEKPISSGNIGVMAHECDDEARKMFVRKVNKKFKNGQGQSLSDAAFSAWQQTIQHYSDQGYLFGGNLYTETVTSNRLQG